MVDVHALRALHADIRACTSCALGETRIHAVPGEGGPTWPEQRLDGPPAWSGVMCVGEAPGRNEDETGRPFCGAAGKNLDLGLQAAGLARSEVFVTSINKCRPPKNRDPKPAEKAACKPWLDRQVELLQPDVLVALGRHGLSGLVADPPRTFGDVRGRFMQGPGDVPVFCSLHPAAIIYRQAWRETYLDDWKWLGDWVRGGAMAADVPPERRV